MPPPARASVLLVEDDPALREIYRRALQSSRYRVSAAGDGLSALSQLERERPDLLVLDLALPRVSGWDVYRDLRGRRDTEALPIIIVTGNDLRDIPETDLVSFMTKPVDPLALVTAVDAALAGV